ncbi:MAG TPA: ABC transporter permease subunit [Caldilineae bacterium]|nr:ABC transporter permease subunit [Caldilineae bacterium]
MSEISQRARLHHQPVPFWRDVRVLAILTQVVFVLAVALVAGLLYANMTRALAQRGLSLGFGFLRLEAGFEIGEGIRYSPSDTYGRAFLVGVVNTLLVSGLGIVLATILGVIVGVARLSGNWLLTRIAGAYIELIRNTPLLVQLVFWYFAVILKLPPVRKSLELPGGIYIHQRGVTLPRLIPTPSFRVWLLFLVAGVILGITLWQILTRYQIRTGRTTRPLTVGFLVLIGLPAAGWFLVGGSPVSWEMPILQRFNFTGGRTLTPEFTALLVGLVIYTAAFIAEIVRGGILAVPRGQLEAARALGLSNAQVLRLVIFPQALRIIIPPLTSQYLNLAKNSSLAIAVGYPDLFAVGGTIANQTGQPVPVIILIMGSYLTMSLVTALFMNWYNRRVQFVVR